MSADTPELLCELPPKTLRIEYTAPPKMRLSGREKYTNSNTHMAGLVGAKVYNSSRPDDPARPTRQALFSHVFGIKTNQMHNSRGHDQESRKRPKQSSRNPWDPGLRQFP